MLLLLLLHYSCLLSCREYYAVLLLEGTLEAVSSEVPSDHCALLRRQVVNRITDRLTTIGRQANKLRHCLYCFVM
jgi:hypothetical protein